MNNLSKFSLLRQIRVVPLCATFFLLCVSSRSAETPHVYQRVVVLTIGIEDYQYVQDAQYAEADARAVGETFRSRYAFKIVPLLGKKAKRDSILQKLQALASQLGERDALIIYFAGHGKVIMPEPGRRRGFLVPYDARVRLDENVAEATWEREAIDMQKLVDTVKKMNAQHVIVVADACCSGFLVGRGNFANRVDLQVLLQGKSRCVLAATTADQVATSDSNSGQGYFTSALLETLKGYDAASVTDLFVEVRRRVMQRNPGMTPQMGRLGGGDGEFVFLPRRIPKSEIDFVLRTANAAPEAKAARGHVLTTVMQRARERANLQVSMEDLLEVNEMYNYRFGLSPEEDQRKWQKRYEDFRAAAAAGDPLGLACSFLCLAKGLGTEPNVRESAKWARIALDMPNPPGMGKYLYGLSLYGGIGMEANPQAGARLIRESAQAGFLLGEVDYARLLIAADESNQEAVQWLKNAAVKNSGTAHGELGVLYSRGAAGLPKDNAQAISHFTEAARLGAAGGSYALYEMFEGRLGQRDSERAEKYLRQAAGRGISRAQYRLGVELAHFPGATPTLAISKDVKSAIRWLELAANQQHPEAQALLAFGYAYGRGVQVNFQKAKKLIERAAATGNDVALIQQGNWYRFGEVYQQDHKQAIKCYEQAALNGNWMAMTYLGSMLDKGEGVDIPQAVRDAGQFHKHSHQGLHWYIEVLKNCRNDFEHREELMNRVKDFRKQLGEEQELRRRGLKATIGDQPSEVLARLSIDYQDSHQWFTRAIGLP